MCGKGALGTEVWQSFNCFKPCLAINHITNFGAAITGLVKSDLLMHREEL